MQYSYLNISDFEQTQITYEDPSLVNKATFHKKGGKYNRIYYQLPNGFYLYFYLGKNVTNKKERDRIIAEFRSALLNGLFPKSGYQTLVNSSLGAQDYSFPVFLQHYFSTYAIGIRQKSERTIKNQTSALKMIINYFNKLGIISINQITDDDLKTWDQQLHLIKKRNGSFFSKATLNGQRKLLRAFLNTAKENGYKLSCDPSQMNIYEYGKGGKIDHTVNARLIIYPEELIEAVKNCSFQIDKTLMPDMRNIIIWWKEVGLRPQEMLTLSENNIVLNKDGVPIKIRIIDQPNCPRKDLMGFFPKNPRSYRELPLSNWARDFIKNLLEQFKGIKRYGRYKGKLEEYPFLFVFWDKKEGKYVKNDDRFNRLFKEITSYAIEEYKLGLENIFIPYDLRRACNKFLRAELGFAIHEASTFLGHSEKTNQMHYSLDQDKVKFRNSVLENAFKRSIQINALAAQAYSGSKELQPIVPKVEVLPKEAPNQKLIQLIALFTEFFVNINIKIKIKMTIYNQHSQVLSENTNGQMTYKQIMQSFSQDELRAILLAVVKKLDLTIPEFGNYLRGTE